MPALGPSGTRDVRRFPVPGRRTTLTVAALAAAALVAPAPATAAPPQPKISYATGDVQIVAKQGERLVHTVRHANGAWDGYGDLYHWDYPSHMSYARPTSATLNGEEHVVYETSFGRMPPVFGLAHEVRHGDGYWNDAGIPATYSLTHPHVIATALGQLHMIASDGTALHHSVQQADGTWTAWQPVPVDGASTEFAAAGEYGDLRAVFVAPDGASLVYAVHHSDDTWSPPQQVALTTGSGAITATRVSVAEVGDDLHVVVLGNHGDVYHSILHPSGRWDGFGYIGTVAGEVGTVTAIAAAASQGALQVAVANSAGGLYHTIRFANGSWQHFADVGHEIGDPGPIDELTLAGD